MSGRKPRYRRWLLAAAVAIAVLPTLPVAAAQSVYGVYVEDGAGVLSGATEETLYRQAIWLQEATGTAQVAALTVADLGGRTLEEYAVAKFRELGLGSEARDDGVLLLYAAEGNRVRIEVGYGLEGRITDGKAGAILDRYFVPYRDAGQLDEAFLQTQTALVREAAAEYGIDAGGIGIGSGAPEPTYGTGGEGWWAALPWWVKTLLVVIVIGLIVLDFSLTGGAFTFAVFQLLGRRGGGGGGGWAGGGRGGGGSSGGGGASR